MDMLVLDDQQLYMDTGCSLDDQPEVMDDRDKWQERGKSVLAAQHNDDDNITNHTVYLPQLKLLWSSDIHTAN